MRIISGKYKGTQLVSFKADHIRPTTDRVKESIFNKWMPYVEGSRCLDLFSGTGNLSIEALSRGAVQVVAVEKSKKSMQIMNENLNKVKADRSEIRLVQDDVFKFLKNYADEPFDLIFVDPPFTEKLADSVMTALSQSRAVGAGTQIVIESGTKEAISDEYMPLRLLDRRPFGDKTVSYFEFIDQQ